MASARRTSPARTASQREAWIASSLPPWTRVSVAVSAGFPRQASWPRLSGRERQAAQLRCHEIHDIVGEALGADARQVPAPARCRDPCWSGIEGQQRLFGQRGEELDREERIAGRLLEHQLGQGRGAPWLRMQGIRQQPLHILRQEGRQHDLLQPRPGVADHAPAFAPAGARKRPRCPGRRRSAADGAPRDG